VSTAISCVKDCSTIAHHPAVADIGEEYVQQVIGLFGRLNLDKETVRRSRVDNIFLVVVRTPTQWQQQAQAADHEEETAQVVHQ
jgi:glycerate kinase